MTQIQHNLTIASWGKNDRTHEIEWTVSKGKVSRNLKPSVQARKKRYIQLNLKSAVDRKSKLTSPCKQKYKAL